MKLSQTAIDKLQPHQYSYLNMATETILLVEDNNAVALGLVTALTLEGYHVHRAATVAGAREIAREGRFDLILLDIRLPDGSGFDLCREFREAGLPQPILMLTARDETIDKVLGLELGADDYLTKPFELRELLARIRALLRRAYGVLSPGDPTQLSVGELLLDRVSHRLFRGQAEIHLTPTEFRLLAYLAQRPGEPIDRDVLALEALGYQDVGAGSRTVDVHIRNLRQKIEPDPTHPILIQTVRGTGYRFAPTK